MVLVKKAADCSQIFHIYSFKGDGRLKKEIDRFKTTSDVGVHRENVLF